MAPSILARSSEYGNNRIILGFHYPLDVMGGRMIAQSVVAHRWADPQFAPALMAAHAEIEKVLGDKCQAAGFTTLKTCAGNPYAGLDDASAVALYTDRLDYGFPRTHAAGQPERVPAEASMLLATTFPNLTDAQRASILAQTAIDSGTGLDRTWEEQASWMRIDLAKAMTAAYTVNADGSVTVTNYDDVTARNVASLQRVEVAGVPLDGFDPVTRTYVVDWPADAKSPSVKGVPTVAGAKVSVVTKLAASGEQQRVITVTSVNGQQKQTYVVQLHRTADVHVPAGVQLPTHGTRSLGANTPVLTPSPSPTGDQSSKAVVSATRPTVGAGR